MVGQNPGSFEATRAFKSDAYQEARKYRLQDADCRVFMEDGIEEE